MPLECTDILLLCDVSCSGSHRPYVPAAFRYQVFELLHSLTHPSIFCATQHLLTSHYVWPKINTDVRKWIANATRSITIPEPLYPHSPPPIFALTMSTSTSLDRYHHLMVLHTSSLVLTDSHTGPKLFKLKTSMLNLSPTHSCMVGLPTLVFPHQSPPTEDTSLNPIHLLTILGSTRIRTSSYHHIANGMIEQFHHQLLKAALKSHLNPTDWSCSLPLVLLGIRIALKEDLGCTAAELVYGTTLRLPGSFFLAYS